MNTLLNKKLNIYPLCIEYKAFPLLENEDTLYLSILDINNYKAADAFRFATGKNIELVQADKTELYAQIEKLTGQRVDDINTAADAGTLEQLYELDADTHTVDNTEIADEDDEAPIVRFINQMLSRAVRVKASDIHFEPYEKQYRVRFRIDGVLQEITSPPQKLAQRLAARLKIMSKLDIAERRIPQDGRIKLKLSEGTAIDLRVSTLPTLFGEKVVLRILDSSAARLDIDQLGFTEQDKALYKAVLARPQGLILVTGPTGSGKTVTLYTGLARLNTPERNISTAEDPVEINLSGVNQTQINTRAGLTFASALRAFLRQDPDVVMVGEIRDLETAEIAVKAAQTGHLVLSTLHTNSAAETLTRLSNMGVPAYNIASSVNLIIAQRLARRLCPHCRQELFLSAAEQKARDFTPYQEQGVTLFKANPQGCDHCSGGYKGRTGIYELMPMSPQLTDAILRGAHAPELTEIACQQGMLTLRNAGYTRVLQGVTSLEEIDRVTGV
ncbi:MAG: type IV-A pilus assembly ATPase PilB [Plesiomonas sp.]